MKLGIQTDICATYQYKTKIENVMTYQLDRYAKERGIDLRGISYEERLNLTDNMINKSYPGDIAS